MQVMASEPVQKIKRGKGSWQSLPRPKLDGTQLAHIGEHLQAPRAKRQAVGQSKHAEPSSVRVSHGRVISYLYGLLPGVMQRAKHFHQFLWQIDARQQEETDQFQPQIDMDQAISQMSLKLFLQLIGVTQSIAGIHDALRHGYSVGEVNCVVCLA